MKVTFNKSDAWVLESIKYGQEGIGGANLKNIVLCADFVNHAIFTFDELQTALKKLLGINYVIIELDKINLTTKFHTDEKSYCKETENHFKELDELFELLKRYNGTEIEPLPEISIDFLTKEKLDTAIAMYTNEANAMIEQILNKKK